MIKVECVAALFEDHEFRGAPKVDNDELVVSGKSWVGEAILHRGKRRNNLTSNTKWLATEMATSGTRTVPAG